ncbi:MAG: rhomboid family intramembrane serine protease [Bacteroidia bacterium]
MLNDIKRTFNLKHNGLNRLIAVNLILFVVIGISDFILKISHIRFQLEELLMLPPFFTGFMEHFWTLFTYMFTHTEFGHLFYNMLTLYFIGSIFCEFMGSKRLVGLYFMGGLSGGILFMLMNGTLPLEFMKPGPLLGASAGIMAVVAAIGVYAPNLMVNLFGIWPVKLKYVALGLFVVSSVIDLQSSNTGGKISHFGGAIFGLVFALRYQKGVDITRGATGIFDSLLHLFRKREKRHVKMAYKRPVSDEVYNESKVNDQKKMNDILDKISRSGYESLSKEEKDFLFNTSKKL